MLGPSLQAQICQTRRSLTRDSTATRYKRYSPPMCIEGSKVSPRMDQATNRGACEMTVSDQNSIVTCNPRPGLALPMRDLSLDAPYELNTRRVADTAIGEFRRGVVSSLEKVHCCFWSRSCYGRCRAGSCRLVAVAVSGLQASLRGGRDA